jgi:hypothetical protein
VKSLLIHAGENPVSLQLSQRSLAVDKDRIALIRMEGDWFEVHRRLSVNDLIKVRDWINEMLAEAGG